MKTALLLSLAVILADSTGLSTIRLSHEYHGVLGTKKIVEVDSVTAVTLHNNNLWIQRKKNRVGPYPIHVWTIDGIKGKETK